MKPNLENVFAFDTETHLIGKGAVIPKLVCVSYCIHGEHGTTGIWSGPELKSAHRTLLAFLKGDATIVGHNLAFDLCVVCREWPDLIPFVFNAGENGRLYDTAINEKLLKLSTDGFLGDERYTLADIALKYGLGDRTTEKEDPNSWRLRFSDLDGIPSSEYPQEAYAYALQDATDAYDIFYNQVQKARPVGSGSMNTASFQAAAAFALTLSTAHGVWTDLERVNALEKALEKVLSDSNLEPLYSNNILRRAESPKIRNPKAAAAGATPVYTKPKPPSVDTKALRDLVVRVSAAYHVPLRYTDSGLVSTDDETMTALAGLDPILDKYVERQEVVKLQTTYVPNLKEGIVYPNYDVLKETGRTSSYKGKGKKQLYPSTNIQNQPRLSGDLSVRECYVPRPGMLFCSVDYSALELCSLAQVVYWLFGHSSLRDQINAGIDPHAFFGAQICHHTDEEFRSSCGRLEQQQIYERFLGLKETDKKKYKHYRTFAKPTNLGYPGGLGPETFRAYAKATYDVEVSLSEAQQLRDLWFWTYPEHKQYLQSINQEGDPHNVGTFCYTTPMGMYRAGATYCAAANGKALQSPSAEGAKAAVWAVSRAFYDPGMDEVLFGCRMIAFIHDEIIMELPDDSYVNERVRHLAEIMRISMARVLPDVRISAEPALMRRWYKEAEPVYDSEGQLVPWEPERTS